MAERGSFDKYLTTCFSDGRDLVAANRFYEADYKKFLPKSKDAVILDIGCGTGDFLRYLKSKGYLNASGVDVSGEMVEYCRKIGLSNVELVSDLITYLMKNSGKFDAIVLNDVIEHLKKEEIVDTMAAVRASLKKGGILILRTINFSTLGGIYLRYKDFTHTTAFTEFSLRQVLLLAGFSDIKLMGNSCVIRFSALSLLRFIFLNLWFMFLKLIYLLEVASDRPGIYSKLLIAVCKNE